MCNCYQINCICDQGDWEYTPPALLFPPAGTAGDPTTAPWLTAHLTEARQMGDAARQSFVADPLADATWPDPYRAVGGRGRRNVEGRHRKWGKRYPARYPAPRVEPPP